MNVPFTINIELVSVVVLIIVPIIVWIFFKDKIPYHKYNSEDNTLTFRNIRHYSLTINKILINDIDISFKSDLIEDDRTYPLKLMSNEEITFSFNTCKTTPKPKNCRIFIKRRLRKDKVIFFDIYN